MCFKLVFPISHFVLILFKRTVHAFKYYTMISVIYYYIPNLISRPLDQV